MYTMYLAMKNVISKICKKKNKSQNRTGEIQKEGGMNGVAFTR